MGKTQEESKLAVASGYWPLYRYNPALKAEGKNPFIFDSKPPDGSLRSFLGGEVRYASLWKTFPEEATRLTAQLETEYFERYNQFARLAGREIQEPASPKGIRLDVPEDGEACILSGTAEHIRPGDAGESCDDGRAGK